MVLSFPCRVTRAPTGARPGGGAYWHNPLSRGLTTCSRGQRGWVHCVLGGSRRQGIWQSDPWLQKLALGTGNVTSLMGKELGLVCEDKRI